MRRRLFLGLPLEGALAERLQGRVVRQLGERASCSRAEDMHLTLAFLGELDEGRVPALRAAAAGEFSGLHAPELEVSGDADAFPDRQGARSVFMPVGEASWSSGRLAALHNRARQLALAFGGGGGRRDIGRPFRPHVTVARWAVDPSRLDPGEDLDGLGSDRPWLPIEVTLYESVPGRAGKGPGLPEQARYAPLAAWPLAVRPG